MPSKDRTKLSTTAKMSFTVWAIKMFIGGIWDILDAFIGWIPVLGTIMDIIGVILAGVLWGRAGLVYAWEVLAFGPLNVLDGLVPTQILIGSYVYMSGQVEKRNKGRKKNKYDGINR